MRGLSFLKNKSQFWIRHILFIWSCCSTYSFRVASWHPKRSLRCPWLILITPNWPLNVTQTGQQIAKLSQAPAPTLLLAELALISINPAPPPPPPPHPYPLYWQNKTTEKWENTASKMQKNSKLHQWTLETQKKFVIKMVILPVKKLKFVVVFQIVSLKIAPKIRFRKVVLENQVCRGLKMSSKCIEIFHICSF